MSTQHCPICIKAVRASPRYPQYVCGDCVEKATDAHGRRVDFYNNSLLGTGVMGKYTDDATDYLECICYIAGKKCLADEAYFGGIVVQLHGENLAGQRA
jgi:hypothetical protein